MFHKWLETLQASSPQLHPDLKFHESCHFLDQEDKRWGAEV